MFKKIIRGFKFASKTVKLAIAAVIFFAFYNNALPLIMEIAEPLLMVLVAIFLIRWLGIGSVDDVEAYVKDVVEKLTNFDYKTFADNCLEKIGKSSGKTNEEDSPNEHQEKMYD